MIGIKTCIYNSIHDRAQNDIAPNRANEIQLCIQGSNLHFRLKIQQ